MGKPVHSQITTTDIGFTANKAVTAGVWNSLGYVSVGVTEQIQPGYDIFPGLENANGRAYAVFKTAADVVIEGELKIVIEDAQGNTLVPLVMQATLDNLNQGATDMTKRMAFPESGFIANRERRIAFYIKPTTSVTLDYTKCKMLISASRYSL